MVQFDNFNSYQRFDVLDGHTPSACSPPKENILKGNDGLSRSVTVIPFNQGFDLIYKLDSSKHSKLYEFFYRFGGLCELVCNRILIDGLLGRGNDENFIKNHVTVERMDEDKIKESHLLDVYSVFRRALAFLFGIYPDNILSCFDQWRLVNATPVENGKVNLVNRKILSEGFKNIQNDETLKLEVFCKSGLSFLGHALLIKKMDNDRYVFFDPNTGEHRDLSFDELSDKIDWQLANLSGTDIFLLKGDDYLKRLKNK